MGRIGRNLFMKRRRRKRTGLGVIAIMVLCICGVVSYKRIELSKEREKTAIKLVELNRMLDKEEETAKDLKSLKAYVQTNKYIEEMARELFGLVYEDEIVFRSNKK